MPLARSITVAILLTAVAGVGRIAAQDSSVFKDATAYCGMSENETKYRLRPHGAVTLGVELTGDEKSGPYEFPGYNSSTSDLCVTPPTNESRCSSPRRRSPGICRLALHGDWG